MVLLKTFQLSARCLKEFANICSPSLTQNLSNKIINKKPFPTNLKLADLTPVFKNIDSTLAENYRPVSVLPTVSKVFEKLMQKQVNNLAFQQFSNSAFLCGYGKRYSTQKKIGRKF